MASSIPLRTFFALALSSLLFHNATAQTLTATNDQSSTGPAYDLDIQSRMSQKTYTVDPVTDRSTVTKVTLEGTMVITTPSNVHRLLQSNIAYISCDDSAYNGNLNAADTFRTAINLTPLPVAVVLYSLNSTHCSFSPNNYPAPAIYSMKDSMSSSEVLAMLQTNTTIIQNSTITQHQGGGGSGGILGKSPTTAVAMIILYSITGIITALFLIIIVVGAIRAHRHPERYGPRNVIGRPRQSRAKGIARAMLETIPIVKFGDHEDLKPADQPRDIEMHPHRAIPETPSQSQTQTEIAEPDERRETSEGSNEAAATQETPEQDTRVQSTDNSMANADNGLACSVCTDDFAKGQDVRVLPCNHKFHPECIDPWLLNVSGTCPLCRVDLRPTASDDNEVSETQTTDLPPRRHSEALTSFAATPQQQGRRSSRARPLHYLHHYLNRGRMEEATPQERLEALRRLRLVNRSDVDNAALPEGAESSAAGESRNRNRLSARLSRAFGGDRSRPSSWAPGAPTPAVPETRDEPENAGTNAPTPVAPQTSDGSGSGTLGSDGAVRS